MSRPAPSASRRGLRSVSSVINGRSASLMLAVVVIFVYLSIHSQDYFTKQNIINLFQQMTPAGIAALGTAPLVIAGSVDLSIGSVYGLAALSSALLAKTINPQLAIVAGVVIAALCGWCNGMLVWRIRVSPIIVTLGSLTLIRAVVELLTQGEPVLNVPASYADFGSFQPFGIPIAIFIMLVGAVVVGIIMAKTTVGLRLYAMGGNREAAEMAGVRVRRLLLTAFLINGALVGLAGVLSASRFGSADPTYGVNFELTVLTTVILGGVAFNGGEGTIFGAMLGAAFITLINSGLVALAVNAYYGAIVQGGALIVAVALDQIVLERRERRRRVIAMRDVELAERERTGDGAAENNVAPTGAT